MMDDSFKRKWGSVTRRQDGCPVGIPSSSTPHFWVDTTPGEAPQMLATWSSGSDLSPEKLSLGCRPGTPQHLVGSGARLFPCRNETEAAKKGHRPSGS